MLYPPLTNPPSRPGSVAEDALDNGYASLIAAVIERAVLDALGRVGSRGCAHPTRTQREARDWLRGRGVEVLLELGGYDPRPIVTRVRRVLEG